VALPLDRLSLDAAAARRMRLLAIALMIGAMGLFVVLDTTAKYLSQYENPLQIAWLRYVFHALFGVIILNPWTTPGVWRTKKPGMQMLRSVLLAATTVFNFSAVAYLQLDQAIAIAFVTPLVVALLSGPIIGEWVSRRHLIVILIGLSGVLLVTKPGFGEFHFAYLLALGNALCGACYNIATRFVSAYDSAKTSIAITSLFGALALAPVMPFVWHWPDSAWIWALHIFTGALGGFGHYLFILAHARAPAPVLAPFIYIELLFMILTGWLVFSDVPDVWTLAGAGIVIAAGIYLLTRERRIQPVDLVE
jgi:drug/metabolite transporter (DMT)-like permease